MTNQSLVKILGMIDAKNHQDPNRENWKGYNYAKEFLYGARMSTQLKNYIQDASVPLQIAARGHHICRWEIPRTQFPIGKKGYYQWRTSLYEYHAKKVGDIMQMQDVDQNIIDKTSLLITKKNLRTDADSKTLEDVICFVFLKYYADEFCKKHTEEKVIDILQKTWKKMTAEAKTYATHLDLSDYILGLIQKAGLLDS